MFIKTNEDQRVKLSNEERIECIKEEIKNGEMKEKVAKMCKEEDFRNFKYILESEIFRMQIYEDFAKLLHDNRGSIEQKFMYELDKCPGKDILWIVMKIKKFIWNLLDELINSSYKIYISTKLIKQIREIWLCARG